MSMVLKECERIFGPRTGPKGNARYTAKELMEAIRSLKKQGKYMGEFQ
jgi:hypothetical protein